MIRPHGRAQHIHGETRRALSHHRMRRAQLREIDFSFISVCGSYVHSLDPFGRFCFKILLTNPALESTRVRVERTHADTYMDTIDAQAAPAPAAPAATEAMLDDEDDDASGPYEGIKRTSLDHVYAATWSRAGGPGAQPPASGGATPPSLFTDAS